MNEFLLTVGDISIYLSVGIGILYVIGFNKNSKAYRIFASYLILIALIQVGAYYVGRGYMSLPNLYYSHFYYIGQFVLLTWFYAVLLKSKWPYYLLVPVLIYAAYGFYNDPESFYRYNTLGMSITSAILVIYSVLYLYKSITEKGEFVIVSSGIFFYLLSSTLIFASHNLISGTDLSKSTKNILTDLNLILYLLFLVLIFVEWIKNYNSLKRSHKNGSNRG